MLGRRASPRIKRPDRIAYNRTARKRGDRTALEDKHIRRLGGMPCMLTGMEAELHHLLSAPGKRAGRDHRWLVPLAPIMHRQGTLSIHGLGSESAFERAHGLKLGYLIQHAEMLWNRSVELYGGEDE